MKTIIMILASVFSFLPIFMISQQPNTIEGLLMVLCSFIPLIITVFFLRKIWGPDFLNNNPHWKREGFSNRSDWLKNSKTFNARIRNNSVRPIYILLSILAIILGFIFLE
jgi:hypothetical protein